MTYLRNFWNDEQGQDLIEYTLLMAFVALASAALFMGAGSSIKTIWTTTNSQLAGQRRQLGRPEGHAGASVAAGVLRSDLRCFTGLRPRQMGRERDRERPQRAPPEPWGGALRPRSDPEGSAARFGRSHRRWLAGLMAN